MALSSKLWFGGILSQAVRSLTHIYGVSTLCQMPSEGEEMLRYALQGLLVQGAERRTRVGNLSACMIRAHKASGCGVVYRVVYGVVYGAAFACRSLYTLSLIVATTQMGILPPGFKHRADELK